MRTNQTATFGVAALLMVTAYAPAAMLDYRNINGHDYTTPVKSQRVGTCWAFAPVAALESQFEIFHDDPALDLDLSEQHLISANYCGTTSGGSELCAVRYFLNQGITDEATLPYTWSNSSPHWPLIRPYPLYRVTGIDLWLNGPYTTENVKAVLEQHGPLVAAMRSPDDWFTPPEILLSSGREIDYRGHGSSEFSHEITNVFPDSSHLDAPSGYDPGLSSDWPNHAVTVVGYVDDLQVDTGGYWIIKNSWGASWADAGYGYIPYTVLERYERIHAITGEPFVTIIPESSTVMLVGLGLLCCFFTRRVRATVQGCIAEQMVFCGMRSTFTAGHPPRQ